MMLRRMRSMIRRPRGATAVEYMVMMLLAVMVVMAVLKVFGGSIQEKFADANDELSGTLASDAQERRQRSGSGSEGGSSGDGTSSSDGSSGQGADGQTGGEAGTSAGGGSGEAGEGGLEEDEGPGFNPVILLIALGLVGLLVYVMVKGKN